MGTTNGIRINLSKANIEKEKKSQTNITDSNLSIPNDPKNSPHKSKTSISLNLNKSNISQETISAKPQEKDNIPINDKSRSIKINPNSTNPDDESSKKGDNSHVSESANINSKEEQKMLSNTSENNRSKGASKASKD